MNVLLVHHELQNLLIIHLPTPPPSLHPPPPPPSTHTLKASP